MSIWIVILFWAVVALICVGIWHEEKLAKIEHGVAVGVKQTVKEWRDEHDAV